MSVSSVLGFESFELAIEFSSALVVGESITDFVLDEDDVGIGLYLIWGSRIVTSILGRQAFRCSVGDYFLSGRVVLGAAVPV